MQATISLQPASTLMARISIYRELSKSGIVALVLISVFGGYLCGHPAGEPFSLPRMILTLMGVLFLASGSSALNQFQERHRDAEMERTAGRPIPSGRMSKEHALAFVGLTLALGVGLLSLISPTVLALGLMAVASYNGLYTLWWKRSWAFAAIPGAVPGALPILMGHAAASGTALSTGGLFLFALLFCWQMPHFWVLALRYRADYAKGGFPTLPVAKGTGVTVRQIAIWSGLYVLTSLAGPLFLPVGKVYLSVATVVSAKLLWDLRTFVREPESSRWLPFFLWINLSLTLYLVAAVADLWSPVLRGLVGL